MKRMTFAATGDALIMKHLPTDYEGLQSIYDYIMQAEARIVNLETTLTNGDCYGAAESGGTWLTVSKDILEDLLLYGFNLFGCANNHTMDYSYEGLLQTKQALEERGIIHAGAGRNLFEASRPGILDSKSARVALISICSTFHPDARAGRQSEQLPGRPGLNPLRFSTCYEVTQSHLEVLKEIAQGTKINGLKDSHIEQGFEKAPPEGTFEFGGKYFKLTNDGIERRTSKVNPEDLERTIHTIQDAKKTCDYVVVQTHSHEVKGDSDEEADYFLEEFSHKCIEAGACAVIGSGTHQLKGIEIYQGKPIFYSLGNFIFENEYVRVLPADYMEKLRFPLDLTATEGIMERTAHAKNSLQSMSVCYRTVIPYFEFEDEKLITLKLKPLELGQEKEMFYKNIPYPANETVSKEIGQYLNRVSSCYGTKFEYCDGIIRVKL